MFTLYNLCCIKAYSLWVRPKLIHTEFYIPSGAGKINTSLKWSLWLSALRISSEWYIHCQSWAGFLVVQPVGVFRSCLKKHSDGFVALDLVIKFQLAPLLVSIRLDSVFKIFVGQNLILHPLSFLFRGKVFKVSLEIRYYEPKYKFLPVV